MDSGESEEWATGHARVLSPNSVNEDTRVQIALLGVLREALAAAGIQWWLFGGWAIDARAGRVTRDHADIEAFVWLRDADGVRRALTEAGFVAPPALHPDEGQPCLREGQEFGVWFLARTPEGAIVTPGRWADRPWLAGSFEADPALLEGMTLPAMSAAGLLDMKLRFERHPHGAPPRAKDEVDIALLRQLVARDATTS